MRRQRVGVDHGGHRIGGVMEAIDELEAQGDQQCQAQQQEGRPGGDHGLGIANVLQQAVGRKTQAQGQDEKKRERGDAARLMAELGAVLGGINGRCGQGIGVHRATPRGQVRR
ncbi:hypothetical protein D9M71_383090 [compost metagenome]